MIDDQIESQRSGLLRKLQQYYLDNLAEDPLNYTIFDQLVLDALEDLKYLKYEVREGKNK